jgi:hypothetical protein
VAGCTSWRVVTTPPPAQLLAQEKPNKVLVTRQDGSLVILRLPHMRGDTLIGRSSSGLALSDSARDVPVPLTDVRTISVRRHSAGKTRGLIGGILLVWIGISLGGPY